MAASNKGRYVFAGGADIFDDDLTPTIDPASPLAAIIGDYYWGTGITSPPTPTLIPYAWVSTPLARRPATIVNTASVGQVGGSTAYATDATSVTAVGVGPANIELNTDCDADAFNLATFLVTFRAGPSPRQPIMRINLYGRTDAEIYRVMRVRLGSRVTIPDTQAGWPAAATSFSIEGIRHEAGVDHRFVEWSTAALIGTAPPAPGPWFRWDTTAWFPISVDMRPF